MRDYVKLFINGAPHQISGADSLLPLSSYLRYQKSLTGTKVVCEEGDCGACTVLLGRLNGDNKLSYEIIDSCIHFMFQLDGCHIISVEGLSPQGKLHQVQEAMIKYFGSQCGFCTPGFIVAIADLVEKEDFIDQKKIKDKLTGNLCRCTGYEPIVKACLALNDEKSQKITDEYNNKAIVETVKPLQQETVVLKIDDHGAERTVYIPKDVESALKYKAKDPDVKLVAGATDVGVQVNKEVIAPASFMPLGHLSELSYVNIDSGRVQIGALTSWSKVRDELVEALPQFTRIIDIFASEQIKNVGTIGGNIANASPIADSLPFLHIIDAELSLRSEDGERNVNINDFYIGYKKLDLKPNELITSISFNLPNGDMNLYKVSKRKDLDISTFTAAIMIESKFNKVTSARIAYGGVGPVILRLPKTEAFLVDRPLNEETFKAAGKIAKTEITPISDVRASKDFRFMLAENILLKFYFETIAGHEPIAI